MSETELDCDFDDACTVPGCTRTADRTPPLRIGGAIACPPCAADAAGCRCSACDARFSDEYPATRMDVYPSERNGAPVCIACWAGGK